jgi:hypothetical protein
VSSQPARYDGRVQINLRVVAGAVLAAAALWLVWPTVKERFAPSPLVSTEAASDRLPEIIPTHGGLLVIARIKGYETFTRTDAEPVRLMFNLIQIPLGVTVSQVRTAALYQYQIQLEEKWPIRCSATRCVVRTGPVELAAPVAIYSEETVRKTESGWGRFDKAQNLQALEKELSARLRERGLQPRNRDVGLRDGRNTVREFVQTWLRKETGVAREVVVLFPGEEEPGLGSRPLP